jgi:hypothetical protein
MSIAITEWYCSDFEVQDFIVTQMQMSPYSVGAFQLTPDELVDEAIERFGPRRCADLSIWSH